MENFDAINKYGSVFLTKIYEPDENELLLEVKRSMASELAVDVQVGDKILSGCHEVTIDESSAYFTISFINYVSYHVINESYANYNPNEEFISGDYGTFCIFQKSAYMNFVLNQTFANDMYPGELIHYGLFAANHIVHVISKRKPKIVIHNN